MEVVELATNVVVAIEVLAAIYLAWANVKEVRFLEDELRPRLGDEEDLPLFDALSGRAKYVAAVGFYLILLTAAGVLIGPLSDHFPPLRAINGALFLGLIAGPKVIGNALRARAKATTTQEEA